MSSNQNIGERAFVIHPMTETNLRAACELWSHAEGVELAEGESLGELGGYLRRNPSSSQVPFCDDKLVGAILAGHDVIHSREPKPKKPALRECRKMYPLGLYLGNIPWASQPWLRDHH